MGNVMGIVKQLALVLECFVGSFLATLEFNGSVDENTTVNPDIDTET
jgi:hypothetical protein